MADEAAFGRAFDGLMFTAPVSAMAGWDTRADQVVVLDGCSMRCHARMLKDLVNEGDDAGMGGLVSTITQAGPKPGAGDGFGAIVEKICRKVQLRLEKTESFDLKSTLAQYPSGL